MPITIGSNIASLQAQRRLADGTSALTKTYERLSSGQRINRASDDAAGLAISDDMRAKVRIYTKAVSNGNDGISLLTIADSALGTLSDVVTRIRELSEQAANGTYSAKQREALDNEAQALAEEYKRIVQTTSFNGVNIFNGSLGGGLRLQLGIGLPQSLNTSIGGAIGTGSFANALSFAAGVHSSTLGDLNGDGHLDLVTADNAGVAINLGRGDGTFGASFAYDAGLGVTTSSVTLGDLNGDGDLDLAIGGTEYYSSKVVIRLGNGDGTFGAATSFTTSSSGFVFISNRSITVGDLNNDGTLDIVSTVLEGVGESAYVLIGQGNGSFRAGVSYSLSVGNDIVLGDLNNDGSLDLVTAGTSLLGTGLATVRLGRGDGTFGNGTDYAAETGMFGGSNSVTVGDLNADGILDLVTAGTVDGQSMATVRLGLGNGTFGARATYTANGFAVTLGDLNGDGYLDLVTAGSDTNYQGQVSVRLGRGNGSFGNLSTFSTEVGPTSGVSVSASLGDLNGDGVLDIITSGLIDGATGQATVRLARVQDGLGPLLDFSLKTKADALQAMGMLDRSLTNISKQRGTIGASQTRVGVAISNLQSAKENFSAAESRIRDADMAAEAALLTRTQILQQAGAAVLAQANQAPQLALRLLG